MAPYKTKESCRESVENGAIHACIIFPADFIIKQGKQNTISLLVDTSKTNIVELVKGSLRNVITVKKEAISADLTTILVTTLDDTYDELRTQRIKYLQGVIDKNTALKDQIATIKTEVSGLTLDITASDLTVNGIDTTANALGTYTTELSNDADGLATEITTLANNVLGENETTVLNNYATASLSEKNTLSSSADDNAEQIQIYANSIINSVGAVQNNLDSLGSQVTDTNTKNDAVLAKVLLQQEKINEIESTLSDFDSAIQNTLVKIKSLENTDVSSILNPITITSETIVKNTSRLNYIFPTLILLVIMFVAILLSSTLITTEKLSSAKFRIFLTPTSDIYFLLSTFLTVLIIISIQSAILLLAGHFGFGINLAHNLFPIATVLFFAAFVFIFIGMCIGYIFNTEQTAILGAISVGTFFMIISDLIMPIETMPQLMQLIMNKTPPSLLCALGDQHHLVVPVLL
jgi:ABC-type multidrug transport system permease subunit